MNIFRKLLIEKLEENGGYHARHDSYAIEYEVGLYYVDDSLKHLSNIAAREYGMDMALYELVKNDIDWDDEQRWRHAQESIAWGLDGDCCYRMLMSDTAKRFGLSDETRYEVEFGLAGRMGKHLVVTSFEGQDLRISNRDLIEYLDDNEEGQHFSNQWCQALLAMMHDWEVMFTSKIASEEMEYELAFRLAEEVDNYVDTEPHFVSKVWAQRQNLGVTV